MKLKEAGVMWVSPDTCSPLTPVKVTFLCDELAGQEVEIEVMDGAHQIYFTTKIKSQKGKAEFTIIPGGGLGVHYIKAIIKAKGKGPYHRWGSFRVIAKTETKSADKKVDKLLAMLGNALLQAVDMVPVDGKMITYYKSADNHRENIAYPAFGVSAFRYFINDLKSMIEVAFDYQNQNGQLSDHIYGDNVINLPEYGYEGTRKLRSMMADLESGMVSCAYKGWQAHGDDAFINALLPKMEKGMHFAESDPVMFDKEHGLPRRPHTCDEWDFQIMDGDCFINENSLFVMMQGDTGSMFEASGFLAEFYDIAGNKEQAEKWRKRREYYRKRGNEVFWDGAKYQHHIHLDKIDHNGFDETEQLTMSNVWAITRKFADHNQAVSIINEYLGRLKTTGDKYPWWSLQPGYPDYLHYYNTSGAWSKRQGEYANGGLFPLVGGELCRGCFAHGYEETAYKMLDDIYAVMKRDHGAVFTWYDLQGNAGVVAPHHQTNYDPWGIQPWVQAIVEELAGIKSAGKLFQKVICTPRWSAGGNDQASCTAVFPASNTYFSYQYKLNEKYLQITFTGSGDEVDFKILLPEMKYCKSVKINSKSIEFTIEKIEKSNYINFSAKIQGVQKAVLTLNKDNK